MTLATVLLGALLACPCPPEQINRKHLSPAQKVSAPASHPFYREAPNGSATVFSRRGSVALGEKEWGNPEVHRTIPTRPAEPSLHRRRSRWPYVIAAGLVVGAVYLNRTKHYEPARLRPEDCGRGKR